jgi:hypothetical protein
MHQSVFQVSAIMEVVILINKCKGPFLSVLLEHIHNW